MMRVVEWLTMHIKHTGSLNDYLKCRIYPKNPVGRLLTWKCAGVYIWVNPQAPRTSCDHA